MIFLCLNKIQNLILYIPDYINQLYRCKKPPDLFFTSFTECSQKHMPTYQILFDTLPLLNVLNLSIINKNMRMHTQLTKNIALLHSQGAVEPLTHLYHSNLAAEFMLSSQGNAPGLFHLGLTQKARQRLIPHAKSIYHEQVPHHLVVTFCHSCYQN